MGGNGNELDDHLAAVFYALEPKNHRGNPERQAVTTGDHVKYVGCTVLKLCLVPAEIEQFGWFYRLENLELNECELSCNLGFVESEEEGHRGELSLRHGHVCDWDGLDEAHACGSLRKAPLKHPAKQAHQVVVSILLQFVRDELAYSPRNSIVYINEIAFHPNLEDLRRT